MKTSSFLLMSLLLLLSACSSSADSDEMSDDLAAKKELLKERRDELRVLSSQIKALEKEIADLDPDFAPQLTLVTTSEVQTGAFSNYATLQATVQAEETATASAELPGRILTMRLEEGDAVRRGQLIATIDVQNVSSQRSELETAAALAKTVYERQQRLWEQNIGSELQYLEAKNNYERLQQSLAGIDVQLAKRNVYAPISGTVETVFMRAGENAMPGAPIVSIISTDKLKIVADAPEEFLTKLKRGQQVKVNVAALDESFTAPVTLIGKTIDAANRTFAVEVAVPRSQAGKLKTNLLAQVEVLEDEYTDVLVLSQDLVQQEISGRRYVFVATPGREPGTLVAKKTYVETGDSFDNQVVILDGLSVGDQLIETGSRGLVDGQLIALNTDPSPADNGK